ncbi:hypothetical protein RDABS01_025254, partial [Bienertia sinuspersici]
FNFMSF